MKPLLALLILMLSSPSWAGSDRLLQQLQQQDLRPMQLLQQLEQQYAPATVVEFEVERDDGQLQYQLQLCDGEQGWELEFNGQGQLLEREQERCDSSDKRRALKALSQRTETLSELLLQLRPSADLYLKEAELDRDLGINFVNIEWLDSNGDKHKQAYDLDQDRQLPVLLWN